MRVVLPVVHAPLSIFKVGLELPEVLVQHVVAQRLDAVVLGRAGLRALAAGRRAAAPLLVLALLSLRLLLSLPGPDGGPGWAERGGGGGLVVGVWGVAAAVRGGGGWLPVCGDVGGGRRRGVSLRAAVVVGGGGGGGVRGGQGVGNRLRGSVPLLFQGVLNRRTSSRMQQTIIYFSYLAAPSEIPASRVRCRLEPSALARSLLLEVSNGVELDLVRECVAEAGEFSSSSSSAAESWRGSDGSGGDKRRGRRTC